MIRDSAPRKIRYIRLLMTRVSESYASFAVCPDGGRIYCIRTESYIDIILSYIITAHLNENEKVDATYTFYKFVFDTANG